MLRGRRKEQRSVVSRAELRARLQAEKAKAGSLVSPSATTDLPVGKISGRVLRSLNYLLSGGGQQEPAQDRPRSCSAHPLYALHQTRLVTCLDI